MEPDELWEELSRLPRPEQTPQRTAELQRVARARFQERARVATRSNDRPRGYALAWFEGAFVALFALAYAGWTLHVVAELRDPRLGRAEHFAAHARL